MKRLATVETPRFTEQNRHALQLDTWHGFLSELGFWRQQVWLIFIQPLDEGLNCLGVTVNTVDNAIDLASEALEVLLQLCQAVCQILDIATIALLGTIVDSAAAIELLHRLLIGHWHYHGHHGWHHHRLICRCLQADGRKRLGRPTVDTPSAVRGRGGIFAAAVNDDCFRWLLAALAALGTPATWLCTAGGNVRLAASTSLCGRFGCGGK